MKQNDAENARKQKEKDGAPRQPDPETLHTTDPQEHMEGPISSAMQKVKEVEHKGAEEHGDGKKN